MKYKLFAIIIFLLIALSSFAQESLSLRIINASGVPVTGLTDANIKFRISPYGAGNVLTISVTEVGTQGNYNCSGFTTFQLVKLFVNAVEQTWFGEKYSGDPARTFIDSASTETITGNKTFNGTTTIYAGVLSGNLNAGSNRIVTLADPINSQDAVTKSWAIANLGVVGNFDSVFIFRDNRILIDSRLAVDVAGVQYNNIQEAIDWVYSNGTPTTTNRWVLYILPHQNAVTGYTGGIDIRDFIDVVGLGNVKITGVVARSGTMADKDARIENLYFEATDANILVKKVRAVNCVFNAIEDATQSDITIENAQCKGCGFYITGTGVINVSGSNRIQDSFGNKNIGWTSGDDIMNYLYNTAGTYQY